jgi:ParB/RepB/Spo0J family partition protein
VQRLTLALDRITARAGNRAAGGFDEAQLAELAESIKHQGVLQPLLVTPTDAPGRYELVAGERRLRAAQLAGLTEVPVSIMDDASDVDVELAAIIENVQRADVHPLDESDAYERLRTLGLPVTRIVERVGRSRPHVDGRLRLQNLIGAIREYWTREGKLQVGTADQIARLPAEHQVRLWKKLKKDPRVLNGNGLRWWIEQTTDLLSAAPFDRSDETLTDAPACGACPKRFGFVDISLFGAGEDHPDARCGEPGCWKAKVKAHVERTRTALERTDTEYVESGSRKGQIKPYEWSEVDPDAPTDPSDPDYDYNRRAPDPERPVETFLVTDGPEAGRAVQGQRNRSSDGYGGGYVERDWEAERIERERQHAEHLAARRPLFRRYADYVGGDVDLAGLLTEEPMLWQLASITVRGLSGATHEALCEAFGVERDPDESWYERAHRLGAKVTELAQADDGASLLRLILLACAVHHLDRTRHDDDDGDFLVELLERAGIDHAAVPPDPVAADDDEAEGADEPAA